MDTSTTPRRARRLLTLAAAVATAVVTVLPSAPAEAQTVELPVNELAPEITSSAENAVAALDAFASSGAVEDERLLAFHRSITARYVAQQVGADEFAMIDAWSRASLSHQRAVLGALTQVGVPYRTNARAEGVAFDCSGLTSFAWAEAGVDLFRTSGSQIRNAASRDAESAMAGDLVHYPGHIMMYLGVDNAIIHSVQTGRTVEVGMLSDSRARRVSWGDPTG